MSFVNLNDNNLQKRLSREFRFKVYCIMAMTFALGFVLFLFTSIFSTGYSAFYKTMIPIEISLSSVVPDSNSFALMTNEEINDLSIYSL